MAWSNTAFPGMRIGSAMRARALMRLQAANAVLTLLTLGLYRPFAVVRVYRYRLAHLALEVDGDIELRAAGPGQMQPGGAADGVAEFVGLDLSW